MRHCREKPTISASALALCHPQWQDEVTAAIQRAKQRLSHAQVEGIDGIGRPK